MFEPCSCWVHSSAAHFSRGLLDGMLWHTEPNQRRIIRRLCKKTGPKYSCPNHSGTCHPAVDRQGGGKHRELGCWQNLWQPKLELEGKLSTAWASWKLYGNKNIHTRLPKVPSGCTCGSSQTASTYMLCFKKSHSKTTVFIIKKLNSSSSFPALFIFVKSYRRGKNGQGVWEQVRAQQIFFVINL